MNPRLMWALLILGFVFPSATAEFMRLGYGLNDAVDAAGVAAVVMAEVVRRLGGGPSSPTDDGPPRDLPA